MKSPSAAAATAAATAAAVLLCVLLVSTAEAVAVTANFTVTSRYGGSSCDAAIGPTEMVLSRTASLGSCTPANCTFNGAAMSTVVTCETLTIDPDAGPSPGYSEQYSYAGDCGAVNLTAVIRRRINVCLPSVNPNSAGIIFDCASNPSLLSTNFYSDAACGMATQTGGGLVTNQCFIDSANNGRYVRCNNSGSSSSATALAPAALALLMAVLTSVTLAHLAV